MRRNVVLLVASALSQLSFDGAVGEAGWRCRLGVHCCRPCVAVCVTTEPSAVAARPSVVQQSIVTPHGTRHRIIRSNESDPNDFDERTLRATESPAARSLRWDGSDGKTFSGLSRRAAKTSIVDAPLESFNSLFALLDDLPDDDDMRDGDPDIERGHASQRVNEENRRVSFPAYLYAASREEDNDFHLIIGGDEADSPQLMNVEVSGLPIRGPDRDDLLSVRQQFAELLNGELPGTRYDFYNPPIPIRVSGSLFYDVDHPPGQVGPASLRNRLNTSWEIHPITEIEARED